MALGARGRALLPRAPAPLPGTPAWPGWRGCAPGPCALRLHPAAPRGVARPPAPWEGGKERAWKRCQGERRPVDARQPCSPQNSQSLVRERPHIPQPREREQTGAVVARHPPVYPRQPRSGVLPDHRVSREFDPGQAQPDPAQRSPDVDADAVRAQAGDEPGQSSRHPDVCLGGGKARGAHGSPCGRQRDGWLPPCRPKHAWHRMDARGQLPGMGVASATD